MLLRNLALNWLSFKMNSKNRGKEINSISGWYRGDKKFFNKKYLQEWNEFISKERTIQEVDFIKNTLKLKKGARILDLACGHGRHAIELASRGYKIIGQDINELFLDIMLKKAKNVGVKVQKVMSDMREIPFEDEFDAVINMFISFGYLENDREDQKVINNISKSLKKDGLFFMDFLNKEQIMKNYQSKDWFEAEDGTKVLLEREYNYITGKNYESRTRISKGKIEKAYSEIRLYSVNELVEMFHEAGLFLTDLYGSYKGDPLTIDSKQAILVARKI